MTDQPGDMPVGQQPSYYHQLGGGTAVRETVERFYELVLQDDELAPFFADSDMRSLKRHLALMLGQVLGGPVRYAGIGLAEAHRGRGITRAHYAKAGNFLAAVLTNLGASEAMLSAVYIALASVEDQIVEESKDSEESPVPNQIEASETTPDGLGR
jgi:hemoglobin